MAMEMETWASIEPAGRIADRTAPHRHKQITVRIIIIKNNRNTTDSIFHFCAIFGLFLVTRDSIFLDSSGEEDSIVAGIVYLPRGSAAQNDLA